MTSFRDRWPKGPGMHHEAPDWLAALKSLQEKGMNYQPRPHRLLPGEVDLDVFPDIPVVVHPPRFVGPVEIAAATLASGKFVIITDDEDRENEGDLCIAAEFITPEKVTFMLMQAHGTPCVALHPVRVDQLGLTLMYDGNGHGYDPPPMTVSVDAAATRTGVSAKDRAMTISWLADENWQRSDFYVPGHVVPLKARDGGVFTRRGHTEASVDLCYIAHVYPAAAICELMNDDGTMRRGADVTAFAETWGIPVVSVDDIVKYRQEVK